MLFFTNSTSHFHELLSGCAAMGRVHCRGQGREVLRRNIDQVSGDKVLLLLTFAQYDDSRQDVRLRSTARREIESEEFFEGKSIGSSFENTEHTRQLALANRLPLHKKVLCMLATVSRHSTNPVPASSLAFSEDCLQNSFLNRPCRKRYKRKHSAVPRRTQLRDRVDGVPR